MIKEQALFIPLASELSGPENGAARLRAAYEVQPESSAKGQP